MERASTPSAEELFLAAIERAPGERGSFLTTACAGDSMLRAEVEVLLACHDGAGAFLEQSPAPAAFMPDDLDLTRLPERIGKFKIKRLLGAGGMGCVYLAESDDPRRDVALKVVRPGMGSSELVRRFRHEVQVVAVLQHPGIAQLYEAGAETTPGGPLPYFAMEYVHGSSITGHARQNGLGWRERMGLVARVAHAVQHAHQKGVIHRDLKPANILVDALGQPKVLDFGVARLMNPEGGAGGAGAIPAMNTSQGQLIGTLSYMSPEQLSGDSRRVDARADIYALGVVLYELLAGAPPYDVGSGSLGEAVKTIGETSAKRLGEIDRELRGDPEIIVEKAMAKDATARYQSATELAADIERCLADQPITAHRPSAIYQLTKFARRNRALAGSSALAAIAIVAGLIVSIWQTSAANKARSDAVNEARAADLARDAEALAKVEAQKQAAAAERSLAAEEAAKVEAQQHARRADAERAKALQNLEIANGINDFIEEMFRSAQPDKAKKPDLKVREAMERMTVQAIRERYPDNALLRMELNGTIGRTYAELSLPEKAEPHLLEAVALMREAPDVAPVDRFHILMDLGHLYKLMDRFEAGEAILRDATSAAEMAYGPDSVPAIECRNDLASLLLRSGDAGEAERLFGVSAEAAHRTKGATDQLTLVSLNNLSSAMKAMGKREEAIKIRKELLTACLNEMGEEDIGTMTAMNNLAKDLVDAGNPAEAEPLLRRALELRMKVQGPRHRSTLNTRCNLGSCLSALGRLEDAHRELAETVRIADVEVPAGNIDGAKYNHEYGVVLFKLDQHDEAIARLTRAHSAYAGALGAESKQACAAARELAAVYTTLDRPDEAKAWSERATTK